MEVSRHIAGARCVIIFDHKWYHYIEDRIDVRYPEYSCLEEVRNGRVIFSMRIETKDTPDYLIRCLRRNSTRIYHSQQVLTTEVLYEV